VAGSHWPLVHWVSSFCSRDWWVFSLFASGVSAFVSVLERPDGGWTYTIGRMSPFVAFPMEPAYAALNEAEGTMPGPQGWGGSNMIGGSPRGTGSRLSSADVERVINRVTGGDGRF